MPKWLAFCLIDPKLRVILHRHGGPLPPAYCQCLIRDFYYHNGSTVESTRAKQEYDAVVTTFERFFPCGEVHLNLNLHDYIAVFRSPDEVTDLASRNKRERLFRGWDLVLKISDPTDVLPCSSRTASTARTCCTGFNSTTRYCFLLPYKTVFIWLYCANALSV